MSSELNSSSAIASVYPLLKRILAVTQQGSSVQELTNWLPAAVVENFQLQGCHIEGYDSQRRLATVIGGVGEDWLGSTKPPVDQLWDLYEPLTQGKSLRFSSQTLGGKKSSKTPSTWLACPMMNRQELLGSLWLSRPGQAPFDQTELSQLQQIANCYAIALHQSQLEDTIAHQTKEIHQLRQAKNEFLQLISHELFIPLGSIQLSAQTLEKIFKDVSWRKLPQRSQVLRVLSLLSQECRRQKQFVDNLITLMFPEYQRASEPVLMNLGDWLPSLLRTFEPRFEQESLPLQVNIPKEPLLVECDVAQLERLISELITNAIKFTPAEKPVTVTAKATDTTVEIAIANAGVKIPAAQQPRIFEKFYRVPELDRRQYGGSGLGLALVKQLVTNLGGTIKLKSTKQKTTFTVTLPR